MTNNGPLIGLKVVELAGLGPASLACTLLTDLGADVLRLERPGSDAGGFDQLGFGRPVVHLDVATPDGLAQALGLIAQADVVIEGFRPGVAERLGLGPTQLMAQHATLIYARMTGWGQEGPAAKTAGHDINYLALTGALNAIGEAGGPPVPPLNLAADFGGGTMFLVVGILAALHSRTLTGRGQVVDAAMVDGASYLMLMIYRLMGRGHWNDARGSNLLDGGAHFYTTYECADGKYIAVGAIEPQFYAGLLTKLGLDLAAPQGPASLWPDLKSQIAAVFLSQDQDHWVAIFKGSDACVAPVLSMTEAPYDEHLAARGTFIDGIFGLEPAPAPRFSATPATRQDRQGSTLSAFGLA